MVPHLTTALAGPLLDLERRILERMPEIGKDENLNATGAQFVPLAFDSPCIPDLSQPGDCAPNRFYACGVVARLAQRAASLEVAELEQAAPAETVAA